MASYNEDWAKLLELSDVDPQVIMGLEKSTEVALTIIKLSVALHQTAVNRYITDSKTLPDEQLEEKFERNKASLVDDARLYGLLEDGNSQESS
jgi:hypothetical protein